MVSGGGWDAAIIDDVWERAVFVPPTVHTCVCQCVILDYAIHDGVFRCLSHLSSNSFRVNLGNQVGGDAGWRPTGHVDSPATVVAP